MSREEGVAVPDRRYTQNMSPPVDYFRTRRAGPELLLEDTVVPTIPGLVEPGALPLWVGGGVPLGAGLPDLVGVRYDQRAESVALTSADAGLLAYLRRVRAARLDTIVYRTRRSLREVERRLGRLSERGVVVEADGVFRLAAEWRDVLPEIVAIEVKVSDWRRANQQAHRDRVFAHRTYVALPARVASRVRSEPEFLKSGVGVISISDDGCQVVRAARRGNPLVWSYYYLLAGMIGARSGGEDGIRSTDRGGAGEVPRV